jgi:nucleotide-binding universal stress UspA family protein
LHVRENGDGTAGELARVGGVELREASGAPIDEIIAAARGPEVAALVLGARGLHGGARPAGHTALQVITGVRKPVAVVPPDARPRPTLSRILVPLEGSSTSSTVLEDTIKLAHRSQLEIVVLHVHSPDTVPAFADHEPHATRAWEQEFLARHLPTPHGRVSLFHRLGVPADDIISVARATAADLVVLAWKQDLSPGRALVVSETLARSVIPVMLLPEPVPPAASDNSVDRRS